jgi:hypothetical protein
MIEGEVRALIVIPLLLVFFVSSQRSMSSVHHVTASGNNRFSDASALVYSAASRELTLPAGPPTVDSARGEERGL